MSLAAQGVSWRLTRMRRLPPLTEINMLTSSNAGCRLIAYVNPVALSGKVNAIVWVESSQPKQFLKRHYQITPTDKTINGSAKLTLHFIQQEFTDFNAVNQTKLPLNGADNENFNANLRI